MTSEKSGAENITNNEEYLKDLAWAIDMSQGQFSLMLARCNYLSMQEDLIQRLKEICPVEIHEIVLESSVTKIYTTICEDIGNDKIAAVMVLGLESVQDINQLLTSMNVAREEFRKNCLFPLILWINEDISKKFIRLAPDIYSWATLNVFEISVEILSDRLKQQTDNLFNQSLELGCSQFLDNGTIAVNIDDYAEIKTAWQDLQKQQKNLEPDVQANIEFALGREEYINNKIDNALFHYQKSFNFWQGNNELLRQGVLFFNIGWCYYRQAYLARTDNHDYWQSARSYFQQCVEIFESEKRVDLVAKFISPWGEVLRQIQDWQALSDLATKSLELHKNYGTEIQVAQDYGFLAEVYLCHKNPEKAREMSQTAIDISEKNTNRKRKSLYLLILACSLKQLGEIEAAVKILETAKQQNPEENPRLYIQILEELRSLYFEQNQYLPAFETKQTRRSLEQQFGFRAFIGAGRLQPQKQLGIPTQNNNHQEIIAEEIVASGRQRDINRLIARIGSTQYKLTVIHGQSGVGKSSLVNAGLVPALQQTTIGTRDVLPISLRVYTDWIKDIGKLLVNASFQNANLNLNSQANIIEQLTINSQSNILTVLSFDQFEEFFFVCKESDQRLEFFDFLGDCLNIPDVKIVISMREDYLHYLLIGNQLSKMAAINNDILSKNVLYPLGNFLPEDAKEFIAGLCQLNLEPDLIDEVVKDLSSDLGAVRPVELQIVGAQMQTENITTLKQYQQLGPKDKLVEKYLEEIIKDCGEENEQVAQILLYLLTDENNTRPLKTLAELEKDLKALAADLGKQSKKLSLVLQIFVKSGFVFLLPESPTNRYQLVHDYLVAFIRRQQEPQLSQLIVELEAERKQRQRSEERLQTLEEANHILANAQQQAKREKIKPNNWYKLQILLVSVCITGFVTGLRFLGLLQHWEWLIFDQNIRWRPQESVDNRVAIVGIDEEDLHNLKQAAITDQKLAELLNNLKARKPRAIGLGIYRDLPVQPGHQELVKVYKSTPNLVGIEKVVGEKKYQRVDAPPELKALGQVGANDLIVDADGKVRRGLIYVNDENKEVIFSFSLYLSLLYLRQEEISLSEDFQLGKTQFTPFQSHDGGYVRADDNGYQILINYRGKNGYFDTVSMTDILENKVPQDWGRNRIILIGYVGESFGDTFFTPYSSELLKFPKPMNGIEIHANIISQFINSAIDGRPLINIVPEKIEILLILASAGIGVLLVWYFPSWQTSAISIFAVNLIICTGSYIAFLYSWWFPIIPLVLALLSAAITIIIINKEQLEKIKLSRTLELILESYYKNPEASRRAIEYFVISNQGVKFAQEDIISMILYTLKSCDNINDIATIADKLRWISLSDIKENDLIFINNFINVSCYLQSFLDPESNSLLDEVIQSSITILENMLNILENEPKNRQSVNFKAIIDQWLEILKKEAKT